MKLKKHQGVYELINSRKQVTGYYVAIRDIDGKPKKVRVEATNADDAALLLKQMKNDIKKTKTNDQDLELALKMGSGSISSIAEKYFETLKNNVKPKQQFKLYLGSVANKKTIKQSDYKLIQNELQKRDLSPKTINIATDLLRSILFFGIG